jgi:hypothetical protein
MQHWRVVAVGLGLMLLGLCATVRAQSLEQRVQELEKAL